MPKVEAGKNTKHFPYTPKGIAAAKQTAKATGKPMLTGKQNARTRGQGAKKGLKK